MKARSTPRSRRWRRSARVPAHYLMQSNLANPPSAESLVSSESGLVAKCRERQRRFGESWERTTALSMAASGEEPPAFEVVWQDAEMRNPAQVADAATKLQTIGVPQRALFEYIGATPQQIAEWTLEAAGAELVALASRAHADQWQRRTAAIGSCNSACLRRCRRR